MPPRRATGSRGAHPSALPPPIPQFYPGKVNGKGMDEPQWQACRVMLENVYNAMDGSVNIAEIFRELPDRQEYEDYYLAILEPESLDHLATQLEAQAFYTPERFFNQLHLVFQNAMHYNEEESQIWSDASKLEASCFCRTLADSADFPQHQIFEEWRAGAAEKVFPHPDPKRRRPGRPRKDEQRPPVPPGKPRTSIVPSPSPRAVRQTSTPSAPYAASASHALPPPPMPIMPIMPSSSAMSSIPLLSPMGETRRLAQVQADRQVMKALDSRLPRWPGPQIAWDGPNVGVPGFGWWGEGAPDYERSAGGLPMFSHRMRAVLNALEGYRDASGFRHAEALDRMPLETNIEFLYFNTPLTLGIIRSNAQSSRYTSLRDFDQDMTRLFDKGRRWHPEGSREYGSVLVLQRLYNALTAPYPMTLPPTGVPDPSPTLFASLPAGPGNARSMHETTQELRAGAAEQEVGFGLTTYRVMSKDRMFTPEARHKGQAYRVGDYIHLINPDDATRPIIGQVWKTFVPTKGYRTHHVTTVHTADRLFFEREAFKSSHFCDHPVEDIIERASCQFYVKYVRGRPQAPEYFPGWPTYVCNSRYNDKEWLSIRIKNWASCIPEELRQSEYMSIVPFERQVEPPLVRSPFLRGVKGPGFLAEPRRQIVAEDDEEYEDQQRRRGGPPDPRSAPPRPPRPSMPHTPQGGPMSMSTPYMPPGTPGSAPPRTPQTAPMPGQAGYRPAYLPNGGGGAPLPPLPVGPPGVRTIVTTMGGPQTVDQVALREVLPTETAALFERDARGQVLWFSGPPLPQGTIPTPKRPAHSLEYLAYLSKRKMGENPDVRPTKRLVRRDASGEVEVENEQEGEETEDLDLGKVWWAEGQSAEQIAAGLKAVIRAL